jgi:hypothetical protein
VACHERIEHRALLIDPLRASFDAEECRLEYKEQDESLEP